jgi:hypothetical protein
MALVHLVTATYLDTRTLPDANTAFDYPEPDSHAKAFGEHHLEPHPMATGRDIGVCYSSVTGSSYWMKRKTKDAHESEDSRASTPLVPGGLSGTAGTIRQTR